MSKLEKLEEALANIQQELLDLDKFRDTSFLRRFRRQLEGEKSEIKSNLTRLTQTIEEKKREHDDLIVGANQNRSSKMKRNWRYYKAVQQNYFPSMSLREIRKQHKLHRMGLEAEVSDVVWANPSP